MEKYLNLINFFSLTEDFFLILVLLNSFVILFSLLFSELLWPTHLFNNRFSTTFKQLNLNSFCSVLLKGLNLGRIIPIRTVLMLYY